MMKIAILLFVTVLVTCVGIRGAGAVGQPAAGGVTAQTVKVPDSPGSVRGLASDASVSSFTGQVAYQIPIELPGGPGGLAPKLALSYSGALGNGPLGIGWTIGQVGVRRSLRIGVPTYTSNDELELLGLVGGTLISIGSGQYRAEGQGNSIRGVAIDGGYELVDSAGTHYRIGTSAASRLASGAMVAAWYLESVTDVAGHTIDYTYERRSGEIYLTAITWGGVNAFRAELQYEDRSDVVVSWRTGFRIAADRRLTAVKLWSFGAVRQTVELSYDQTFALSRLASVRVVGNDGTPTTPATATPATTLTYAAATAGQVQALGNTGGWNLGSGTTSFFDVDKDGAMDLIRIESGSHRYRRNLGGSFGPEVTLGNAPALAMSSVRMLDLDGDSGAEMVSKSTNWRAYRIVNNSWIAADWPGSSTLDLQTVAVADLNGDNRMDVLAPSGNGIAVWLGTASGFASPRTLPAISPSESSITPATVQFPDLNGDGLADAVAVNSNGLIEFRGRGDGSFERVGPIAYPWTGTTDPTQVRLADLNRDGLLDIVRIGSSQVFWYRGRPDGTFSQQATILTRPPGADSSTVVALADANGNGSTDVVWSSSSGMWVLDLAGPTNAGLLVGIGNGLGKVQSFEYTASAQLAWAAEAAGTPWTERMPVSIAVTTTSTLSLDSGDPDRKSLLGVRDGIYEQAERRFIGFAQSTQTLPGTGAADTIRIVTQFHPGRGVDRALRGQVLSARTEDGAGSAFKLVENQVSALSVAGLPDDPRLKRAAVTQTQITFNEPGETSAVVRTRFEFDDEGRQIVERRDGRVTGGAALDGDESIYRRTYTSEDPTTGVRDLVCEEITLDGAEAVVSRTQRRFGGDDAVAAPCQPGKGWVREELSYLAEEDRWVTVKRASYDGHGNPTVVLAGGVERTLGYDANGLHPVLESVSPAAGQTLTWTAQWDDVAGTLVRVGAPSGVETYMTYDGIGRITATGANGAMPHVYYRYNLASPRPQTETFTFDGDPSELGSLPTIWMPDLKWRHSVVVGNAAGERILTAVQLGTDQWSVGELRRRDHRGRVIAITAPFMYQGGDVATAAPPFDAGIQTLSYDPLDRVVDQVLPTGSHKRATYHPLGVTLAVDGLAPVSTTLDGQDRTIHTERLVGGIVESIDAVYDAEGRVLQFGLQGGQVRHDFTYDSLGRLIHAVDPDVGQRTMMYDDGGRLVSSENGAAEVVTYGYDGAGRLVTVDGTGVTTRYHYDVPRSTGFEHAGGQLAWVEEPTGSVDFGYDGYGWLATQQRTIADPATALIGRETTQFSCSGLPLRADLGDGVTLPYHYDAGGRLAQIEGVWSAESYNAAGLPLREQFGNGAIQRYERDVLDRPTRIKIENASGVLYDVAADYNAFGALGTLTDNDHGGLDHTASFGFDGAGRLTTTAVGTGASAYQFSYAYDGLQNMIRRDASGPTGLAVLAGTYKYRAETPRRLDQIVKANGDPIATFTYDGAGRQIQHTDKHLTYDALSHLIRVDGVAGGTIEHRYGYDGNRVSTRNVAGEMTYWITPNVVVRGSERDHYVRVGDRLVARITTSTSAPGSQLAAAVARVRVGLTGLSLLCVAGLMGLAGCAGLRKRLRSVRMLRAPLAASLALLVATTGCGSIVSRNTSALSASGPSYFHQTYAAGPELTTDAAGEVQSDRRSEPFGVAIDELRDGVVQTADYRRNPINALNKFSDPDTGWSYHGARWLAPDTAQWHSPDPPATAPDPKFMTSPWALHPYQYVNQNPVAYWDPDGRSAAAEIWFAGVEEARQLSASGPLGAAAGEAVLIGAAVGAGLAGLMKLGQASAVISPEMGMCGGDAECSAFMTLGKSLAADMDRAAADSQARTTDAQAQAKSKVELINERSGPVVFRGLALSDSPIPGITGLVARAPGTGNTPLSHVLGRQESQWISTSKSWARAQEKFGKNGVVAIDLSKVHTTVVDLSHGINGISVDSQAWRRVTSDQEVLIQDAVPPDAIIFSTKR
jgi:RHS repeat-associated protein